ncbi:MAG: DNA modification methylase [Deltaproteobacteria bacterium]|nr:DNA modification methylase [Deltaproteobacteria bacterium]
MRNARCRCSARVRVRTSSDKFGRLPAKGESSERDGDAEEAVARERSILNHAIVNERYEQVAIDAIKPHPKNPRRGDLDSIAASIRKNGFYGALIVQRSSGFILAGNHRYLAAKRLGFTELPALFVDVDDRVAQKILLADNRTSDLAGYDEQALGELLATLSNEQDLDGTGYDQSEVDALLSELSEETSEALDGVTDEEDGDPIDPPSDPESKPGEVYTLGPHRLICGDATCVTDLDKLLGGEQVNLLWTDPPYNVDYEGKTKGRLKIQNDKMKSAAFREFLVEAFSTASTAMRPGASFYIAHADTEGYNFRGAVHDVGWKLAQCLIWAKDQFVLGRGDYHWRHEPILYGWKEGAAHHAVVDRTQDTIWECKRPRRNDEHPTMKPVALIERAIRNSTDKGALVLDPFAGSGSTLVAAARAGRVARLVEIDPRYCDVIRRRWARFESERATAAAA